MEVALRSAENNGAADLERVLLSMVESVAVDAALVAEKSLLCFLTAVKIALLCGFLLYPAIFAHFCVILNWVLLVTA